VVLEAARSGSAAEQRLAIEALGSFASEEALELVGRAAGAADSRMRVSAAKALGRWSGDAVIGHLGVLAADASSDVAETAVAALRRIRERRQNANVVPVLARVFFETDFRGAECALEALVEIETPDDLVRISRDWITHFRAKAEQLAFSAEEKRRDDFRGFEAPTLRAALGIPPEIPPITDDVHFSVTAPALVSAGTSFIVDVWAHLERERPAVLRRARESVVSGQLSVRTRGPAILRRRQPLLVRLTIPSLAIGDHDELNWNGSISSVSFQITLPHDPPRGEHVGVVAFYVDQLIAKVHFSVKVGTFTGDMQDRTSSETRIRTAFASYASEDRQAVLARVHGMQKIFPSLSVFLDVASLRSGDRWRKRVEEEILARDVLYLFWSGAASRSPWVEHEWRTALTHKGIGAIDPVPLEPPESAPPPRELSSLHFNEWLLSYMR
jgi:hypothetical protein